MKCIRWDVVEVELQWWNTLSGQEVFPGKPVKTSGVLRNKTRNIFILNYWRLFKKAFLLLRVSVYSTSEGLTFKKTQTLTHILNGLFFFKIPARPRAKNIFILAVIQGDFSIKGSTKELIRRCITHIWILHCCRELGRSLWVIRSQPRTLSWCRRLHL